MLAIASAACRPTAAPITGCIAGMGPLFPFVCLRYSGLRRAGADHGWRVGFGICWPAELVIRL